MVFRCAASACALEERLSWLWQWLNSIICLILRLIGRLTAPNEVSRSVSECIYGWTSAYRIEDIGDCTLRVTVRIRLNPDADVTAAELAALRTTWESGIESTWSGKFAITKSGGRCNCCQQYSLTFDVQFVDSGQHHTVRVRRGPARSNMTTWDTSDTGGAASHEFGHMLGFADEYADPACPSRTVTSDGSIMASNTGAVKSRHYEPFARWISRRTGCRYVVS